MRQTLKKWKTQMKKNIYSDKYLLEIFDIAKYANKLEDEEVYRKAMEKLYQVFASYINNQQGNEAYFKKALDFTAIQNDLMKHILNMICEDKRNFFSTDSMLINVWLDQTRYIPWSEHARRSIWNFLLNVIDAGKDDWFLSYWTFADQYYRFQLNSGYDNALFKDDELYSDQQVVFKEFHIALGAYLFQKKSYELLEKILFFTNTQPPEYRLLDNTLDVIIERLLKFNQYREEPLSLLKQYQMTGLVDDITTNDRIYYCLHRYLALLVVRLGLLDDNVSYCDSYLFPNIASNNLSKLKNYWYAADLLLHDLEVNDVIEMANVLNLDENKIIRCLDTGRERLQEFRDLVVDQIKYIEDHPVTSMKKKLLLKKNLIKEVNRQKSYIPTRKDSLLEGRQKNEKYACKQMYILSRENIAEDVSRISVNLEEVLVECLIRQERRYYETFFLFNKPVVTFTIQFRDVMNAFRRLKLNKNYVVLSMGVTLNTFNRLYPVDSNFHEEKNDDKSDYNGAPILPFISHMLAFIIMDRSSLPYMEHIPYSDGDAVGLVCIDENTQLYSNVDKVTTDEPNLKIAWMSNMVSKDDFTKYVMLKVVYTSDSSDYDIDKIGDIKKYISI